MEIILRDKNQITIFDITGEITRVNFTDNTLHQTVKDQLNEGKRNILLNLSKVEFIDSFGVGEILASFISTQNLGGRLKLSNISKKIYVVFEITMLIKVLEIFDSEDAALDSFV
jgi:anti-sigma B factor antagonist